jgi:hypothetical protein
LKFVSLRLLQAQAELKAARAERAVAAQELEAREGELAALQAQVPDLAPPCSLPLACGHA